MEQNFEPTFTGEGWFSPLLAPEGWFDEDFTASAGGGRVGPTVKSSATANSGTGTGTAFSITLPAGLADGDVGYMVVAMNTQNDRGDPSGWTLLDFTTSGTVLQQKVYWKALTAAESSTNVTFTLSNAQKWDAVIQVVQDDGGVDTDVEVFESASASSAWTLGSVTPTVDDTLRLGFHAWRRAVTGTTTSTPPTGWTEQAETSNNAAASPTIGAGICQETVTGGSGVASGTDSDGAYDGSASNHISYVISIKPVTGGTPITASGSITLGGSATAQAAATASGSVTLGGSATGQAPVTAAGSVTLGGSATGQAPVTASGSVTLGGSATAQAPATASGSVTLGGSASANDGPTAAGSITLAGTGTAQAAATASGSVTLTGTATAAAPVTAAGSVTLGGTSTAQAPVTAAGSVTLGGSATARAPITAAGSITLTGSAVAQAPVTVTGSITLAGTATAAAGAALIPGFAVETFPARTRATLTLTGTASRDTVHAGTTARYGGTGTRTHEYIPDHATAREPQHV